MLGSRVCWQLLLGWALLLGQLVSGDSGLTSSEERSLQEPEKPVSEEPEKPVSEETEESVPEEPETLLPELEEPEDLLPEREEPEEQQVVEQEAPEKKPPSDEELEEMAKGEREWLVREKEKPCGSWLQYLQAIALGHYNKQHNKYYKQDGDARLRTQKAFGTIISIRVVLMKTNCTKVPVPKIFGDSSMPFLIHDSGQFLKNCESLKGSEKECTFTMFDDSRSRFGGTSYVLAEKCHPMHLDEKRRQRPSFTSRS